MKAFDSLWGLPPSDLALSSDHIHVWCASLDQPASCVQQFAQSLSADERVRAERFHFEQHRNRFIAGRGLLRMILSYYTGIEPSRLQFCYGPHGKPALTEASSSDRLCFNLSHSQELALFAVTRDREIGVDLECVRPISDAEQIAERFFSAQENAVFRALPRNQKQQAFFNCWTRKEAYIKARGEGLSLPLKQFDVSLIPGEPAKLLSIRGDPEEASKWSLQALSPAPGYVAALAVEGHGWDLACWRWTESSESQIKDYGDRIKDTIKIGGPLLKELDYI